MPFIEIPTKARDCLLEHAKKLRAAKSKGSDVVVSYIEAEGNGMFAMLRVIYPSEVVGFLVMDYDQVLDGKEIDETFTARLSRVTVTAKS